MLSGGQVGRNEKKWRRITWSTSQQVPTETFIKLIVDTEDCREPLREILLDGDPKEIRKFIEITKRKCRKMARGNHALLNALIATALSFGAEDVISGENDRDWTCFRVAISAQQALMMAFLQLDPVNCRTLLIHRWEDTRLNAYWSQASVGAMAAARVVHAFNVLEERVFLPSLLIDGRYQIDLVARSERKSCLTIQVKTGVRNECEVIKKVPVGTGYIAKAQRQYWNGVKVFERQFDVSTQVTWITVYGSDFRTGQVSNPNLEEKIRHMLEQCSLL